MEAINRQSAVHTLMNRDNHYYSPTKGPEQDSQQPHTSMNAPPLLSPTAMYPNHPPPPYTHAVTAPPSAAYPISGLISPTQSQPPDSRRMSSDAKEPSNPQRQSLPSIQEALYPPSNYPPQRNAVEPSSTRPYTSFSQPPPTPTSRANSMDSAQYQAHIGITQPPQSSPPHHAHPSSYSRAEPMTPSYDNPRHAPLPSIRTALPQQPTTHTGPGPEYLRHEKDIRSIAPVANGYPLHSPHHAQHPGHTSAPPVSTATYSPQSPYPPQRPYRARYEHEDHAKMAESPPNQKVYGPVVKRHLDYWDIEIELANMRNCGNEISRISATLLADAQQNTHHGSMPERMPSVHDIDLMRVQNDKLAVALQRVTERIAAQGQYNNDQHGPPPVGKIAEEYPPEEIGWEESRNMGNYGAPDAKKRRGRAAPPGRCHSCNRAETPEWRRGPDGARTLCNACGLHYAKLTRKLGSKQAQSSSSSLRPTSMGEGSPRA